MTVMVSRTAIQQYQEEEDAKNKLDTAEQNVMASGRSSRLPLPHTSAGYDSCHAVISSQKRIHGVLGKHDVKLACLTLLIVVLCGVFRAHAVACASELRSR